MTPERYHHLCELFDQAQQQPPAERSAFLHEACAGDAALCAELEKLLADDQQAQREQLFQQPCPVNAKGLLPADESAATPVMATASAPEDTLIGRRVGPYLIQERIGSGGMGSVYRALRQDAYHQQVALKVIRPGLDSEEVLCRFHTERQVLADLAHPHLARLLDGGATEDGRPYFVMEYIDGQPLDRYCEGRGLGTRQRVELFLCVCEAVQHAHERGVLHRDLKPGNVLVTADGTVKVTDFGLAKRLVGAPGVSTPGQLTQTGAVLGTPSYMAPEQAAGKRSQVGPAADVYALGAILYELLTGRPPFRAETALDTLLQVLAAEPVPPGRLHPKLARDLETICLKCLQKEPGRRYRNSAALVDDLERFLRGEPIQARPVATLDRLWRWCRRNPVLGAVSGLAAASLAAVVVLGALFAIEQHSAATRLGEGKLQTEAALAAAERNNALLTMHRGLVLCDQGQVNVGLLWLGHALQIISRVPGPKAAAVEEAIRLNLAAWARTIRPLREILPHEAQVRAVAFSAIGQEVFTASGGKTARFRCWQARAAKPAGDPLSDERDTLSVAISPDGRTAASVGVDHKVRMWDLSTRKLGAGPIAHGGKVTAVNFSPDSRILLTAHAHTVRLWDVGDGTMRGSFQVPVPVLAAALSPDGKLCLTGSEDGKARLWDKDGKLIRNLPGHADAVLVVAFSPDGQTCVTGSRDGTVWLCKVATGEPISRTPPRYQNEVTVVAFSPDSRTVAIGSLDAAVRLWEVATARPGDVLWHPKGVRAAAFSPDGQVLLTGSDDRLARLWDVSGLKHRAGELVHQSDVSAVGLSPDGCLAVTGDASGIVHFWDVVTGRALPRSIALGQAVSALAFDRKGLVLLAASSRRAEVWNLRGDRRSAQLNFAAAVAPQAIALSGDGTTVVAGSKSGTIHIWDAGVERARGNEWRHRGQITAVAFSPDGAKVASAGLDGTARLWDVRTGKLDRSFPHTGGVAAVAFAPDGRLIVTGVLGDPSRACLWDVATGEPKGEKAHAGSVLAVAFSPDSRQAATASADNRARLWDLATGKLTQLKHYGPVWAVAFSPDGRRLLTGSADPNARLWDVATGIPIGAPVRHRGGVVRALAFAADSRTFLTASNSNIARLGKVPLPVAGDAERIAFWIQVLTATELVDGVELMLDGASWQERRRRLEALGGPPQH